MSFSKEVVIKRISDLSLRSIDPSFIVNVIVDGFYIANESEVELLIRIMYEGILDIKITDNKIYQNPEDLELEITYFYKATLTKELENKIDFKDLNIL